MPGTALMRTSPIKERSGEATPLYTRHFTERFEMFHFIVLKVNELTKKEINKPIRIFSEGRMQ